jgi:hypothetical protein
MMMLLSSAAVAAALLARSTALSAVAQERDWLVWGGGALAKLRVEPPGNGGALSTMTLTNGLVERSFSFDASGGALCTTEYRHLSSGQTYFRGISPEANLTLTTKSAPGRPCEGSGTTLTRRLASMHSAATGSTGAREEFTIAAVSGRYFRLVFGKGTGGYQPFVSEVQLRVGSRWLVNNGTATENVVTKSSGAEATVEGGLPFNAFDGNITSLWDAQKSDATGTYWIDIDLGGAISFDGVAITTLKVRQRTPHNAHAVTPIDHWD